MGIEVAHRPGQLTAGHWGNHTSSIDWCEDNYVHTRYIAETYNTLSNIPFILLGLHGFLYTRSLPRRTRYALSHAGIAFIGVGSFAFHATLRWDAQVLLDELPMIWVASLLMYIVWAVEPGKKNVKGRDGLGFKVFSAMIPLTVSCLYLLYPNPLFHQFCYACIQISTTLRIYLLRRNLPPTSLANRRSKNLMRSGTLIFLLGFAIWNVDNIFCDELTGFRKSWEGLGWVTQGHAWWHLLTGLGSSWIVTGITYMTLAIEEGVDEFEVVYSLGVPYVRRRLQSGGVKKRR